MWRRSVLKAQGKAAFRRNYWKSVLVGLLLLILVSGGSFMGSSVRNNYTEAVNSSSESKSSVEDEPEVGDGWEYKGDYEGSSGSGSSGTYSSPFGSQGGSQYGSQFGSGSQYGSQNGIQDNRSSSEKISLGVSGVLAIVLAVILGLAVLAVMVLIRIFVGNLLEIGAKRFFLMNLKKEPGSVKEVAYAFDHSWKNAGITMFYRDLYTFLWSLLFIIPGIVKSYEYRMIPYLLAENPEMDRKTAFGMSKQLMAGQKWRTFVLDLSFIGWDILSIITLGLVGIFYSNPYIYSTDAALYAFLRYARPRYNMYRENPQNPQPVNPQNSQPVVNPADRYESVQEPMQGFEAQPAQETSAQPAENAGQAADQPAAETASDVIELPDLSAGHTENQ